MRPFHFVVDVRCRGTDAVDALACSSVSVLVIMSYVGLYVGLYVVLYVGLYVGLCVGLGRFTVSVGFVGLCDGVGLFSGIWLGTNIFFSFQISKKKWHNLMTTSIT